MVPSPRDQKAPRPLPLLARSRGRAVAALVAPVSSGAPTLAASWDRDEGARARIYRGLRAAMHALRDRVRRVGVAPAILAARRLPFQEPPLRGQPRRGRGDGSSRGCARVSCRLQRSTRRVRCPTRERGRGRARSEAPSRAAPANRRTGTAARAATQERERYRALFVVGRCSSSASPCSPFTRWVGKAAWDLRGGCCCKAGQRGGTRNARGSSG
jgi:hypothetical protein